MTNAKVKVNDKCTCGSGVKYKKCCMNKTDPDSIWRYSQQNHSKIMENTLDILQEAFRDICIINITNNLTSTNYETYQIKNYYTNIMMIAEKTPENSGVFDSRSNSEISNIIVMYHGAYRTFSFANLQSHTNSIIESINQMI